MKAQGRNHMSMSISVLKSDGRAKRKQGHGRPEPKQGCVEQGLLRSSPSRSVQKGQSGSHCVDIV